MKVLKYPDEILSTPSQDVEMNKETIDFISEMLAFILTEKWWGNFMGIAAPQLGKNYNIFYAFKEVFINPKMEYLPLQGTFQSKEGCYSLEDNTEYPTKRYYQVKLDWINLDGKKCHQKFTSQDAQIIQHEMDHLQGKLCCNHE